MAENRGDVLGEGILPGPRAGHGHERHGDDAPLDVPVGSAAGSGGTAGDAGATDQPKPDDMLRRGGGTYPGTPMRTAVQLDEDITGLERAVHDLQRGSRWYRGSAIAAAIFGIVVSAIAAFVVADYVVGRYESRLAAATNAGISEIRKAAATERVKIDVEAGNKLVEINEAATKAAAKVAAALPAAILAPPTKAEAPSEKPTAEAPKVEESAPATAAAPAPAAPAASAASSELSALMDKVRKGMKKGGAK